MKLFFDSRQAAHAPARELHNGDWMPYSESAARLEQVAACGAEQAGVRDFGLGPILAVHSKDYVELLKTAHDRWLAAGREGDAVGYTFPVVGRRPLPLDRIDGLLGAHSFDAATPVAAGTWEAAYWSAQAALSALDEVADGRTQRAFALCRPPGHHAGRDYMGGYCYLNSAAIVAREAGERGLGPVAILDVDYHHGNGTQDIFLSDPSIFFASLHADPATDYPFYWGHADERGEGPGVGTTLNLPLPRGTSWATYRPALERALDAIEGWGTHFLIVSFGADTFEGDPISHFALTRGDFASLGAAIAARGLPGVAVMEGGYAVDELGFNVAAFLDGYGSGDR
jgi:acetoin utilization deacetylase AcuC-like enzyme